MAIDFRKTLFLGVAAELDQCPPPTKPEVVLSGRSNVGKSTLINSLADNRKLARTSNTPGKTRLIIYFMTDDQLLLTDLPGYGYARVSREIRAGFSSLADSYLTSGRPIALVLHLLDIRHQPTADDCQMLEWLMANRIPCQIVLTKGDKLTRQQMTKRKREIATLLGLADDDELIVFSAPGRMGIAELRKRIASQLGEAVV